MWPLQNKASRQEGAKQGVVHSHMRCELPSPPPGATDSHSQTEHSDIVRQNAQHRGSELKRIRRWKQESGVRAWNECRVCDDTTIRSANPRGSRTCKKAQPALHINCTRHRLRCATLIAGQQPMYTHNHWPTGHSYSLALKAHTQC